ncbi:MAG: response regulator [Acidobacteriia bacterium]|nr:response regulator [Terriglobia bacterium]
MVARILIIEDHAANLDLMTYLLTAFGYTLLGAANGRSGMEIAAREKPELIICDIQLPDISGYEIAARLKQDEQMRNTPLVAITALAMVGDRERVLQAGFDGYISKPITPETFVAEVESFLSLKQRAPKEHPSAAVSAPEAEPQLPLREPLPPRATILAVDNVRSNLELARSIFEPSGYRVMLADDVEAAMALARQTRPDLVLSDVNMPEGSGLELVLRLKSDPTLNDIPVVLISATLPRDTRDDLVVAAGATRFLRRPIDPIVLLKEIEDCLEMSRRAHA